MNRLRGENSHLLKCKDAMKDQEQVVSSASGCVYLDVCVCGCVHVWVCVCV